MQEKTATYERYQRQILLHELGAEGQAALQAASVLVVGAGGLGCPALLYLAGAGVGTIGIIDNDRVALHNLHRQLLYTTKDIGHEKATAAQQRLLQLNPEIRVHAYTIHLSNQNALELIQDYDMVIDATDNFASRYIINDACVLLKKPLVYAGISQYEGQVAVFNNSSSSGQPAPVNYRDLFPQPPSPGNILNCAEAGVLGVLPGIIGIMQATEAIKLITGIGEPLVNKLFNYNARNNSTHTFQLFSRKETAAAIPKDAQSFEGFDYDWFCGVFTNVEEIDADALKNLLHREQISVIDVRERGELPALDLLPHLSVPLSEWQQAVPVFDSNMIVLICQTGKRSKEAARLLMQNSKGTKKIYSLKGGVLQWKQQAQER